MLHVREGASGGVSATAAPPHLPRPAPPRSGAACPGSGGCNGGYPLEAWNWFKSTGVVTGGLYQDTTTCYPYELAPCSHHEDGKYPRCPSQVRRGAPLPPL